MILGIGNDVLEISRMERELAHNGVFAPGEIFTAAELAYCASQQRPAQHLAARFAAKEALLKALGTGAANLGAFAEVEVVRSPGDRAPWPRTGRGCSTRRRPDLGLARAYVRGRLGVRGSGTVIPVQP
jgi:holo-[acyl-carrier protein] synthase